MSCDKKNPGWKYIRKVTFQEFCHSWWVILILILIGMLYVKTHQLKKEKILYLTNCLIQLETDKMVASLEKQRLLSDIQSLEDPDYVEMLLIQKMGVVPEDTVKVRFKNQRQTDVLNHH